MGTPCLADNYSLDTLSLSHTHTHTHADGMDSLMLPRGFVWDELLFLFSESVLLSLLLSLR